MYVRTLGQSEYQSEAAARRAAEELFIKAESNCRGIAVLKRLRKNEHSLYDEALVLWKRIRELPKLYQDKAELDRRASIWRESPQKNRVFTDPVAERRRIEEFVRGTGALSPEAYKIELAKLLVRLGYPPNYHLRDLNTELRQATCEYSLNSLRFAFPCGGMEVDDPKVISGQVADHYVQTELGSRLTNQRIVCTGSGRTGFCDVYFPNGITIRVSFTNVPYALRAVQVAPKVGLPRGYSYSCIGRKVSLSLPKTTATP
jgi:hypothetical protein